MVQCTWLCEFSLWCKVKFSPCVWWCMMYSAVSSAQVFIHRSKCPVKKLLLLALMLDHNLATLSSGRNVYKVSAIVVEVHSDDKGSNIESSFLSPVPSMPVTTMPLRGGIPEHLLLNCYIFNKDFTFPFAQLLWLHQ